MSSTLAPSVTTHRDRKGLKFMSIVEAAYDGERLPDEEAQLVNDAPGLPEIIHTFITENRRPNRYKNEVVYSRFLYPQEYKGPKPIADQIMALAEIFGLNPAQALEYAKKLPDLRSFVPESALQWTGWFATLWDEALIKLFPQATDRARRYCLGVNLTLDKLAASRSFYNYRRGQIDTAHLRAHVRTVQAMDQIAQTQKGDILIIAAQLGMRYRGHSTRLTRDMFVGNEFGLEPLAGGSIALLHPERFVRFDELDMDLPGAEYSPGADGGFGRAPYLSYDGDGLGFGADGVGRPSDRFGSGSVFSPQ